MISATYLLCVCFLSVASATIVNSVEEFDDIVSKQPYAMVVFSKERDCPSCQHFEQNLQEILKEKEHMYQCQLTIVRDNAELVERYGIERIPQLLFFRDGIPAIYNSSEILPNELLYWVYKARDVVVMFLDDMTFDYFAQTDRGVTNGDWLVGFVSAVTPAVRAKFESLQLTLMSEMTTVALVDYSQSVNLKKRFSIKEDTVLFFRRGKMYRFMGSKLDADAIVDFVARYDKHAKAEEIPPESSLFDYFLETKVWFVLGKMEPLIKQFMEDLKKHKAVVVIGFSALVTLSGVIFALNKSGRKKKEKSQ